MHNLFSSLVSIALKILQRSSIISLGLKLKHSNGIPWRSCFLVKQHNSRTITCTAAEAGNCCLVHFFINWGDLAEGCFVSHKTQCSALVTSASLHSLSASPQKHPLDRSIVAVRQRKDATKLAVFFRFFVPFRRHFNDKQLAKVIFGSSAEVCIQQKSGKRRWEAMISPCSL